MNATVTAMREPGPAADVPSKPASFKSAPFEVDGEFGGRGLPASFPAEATTLRYKGKPQAGENTTIAVIATDAVLTKAECKRLAIMTHAGYARAFWPSHTPFDGDIIFALSTGRIAIDPAPPTRVEIGAAAAACMARAIAGGGSGAPPGGGGVLPGGRGAGASPGAAAACRRAWAGSRGGGVYGEGAGGSVGAVGGGDNGGPYRAGGVRGGAQPSAGQILRPPPGGTTESIRAISSSVRRGIVPAAELDSA